MKKIKRKKKADKPKSKTNSEYQDLERKFKDKAKGLGLSPDKMKFHETRGLKMSEAVLNVANPSIEKYSDDPQLLDNVIAVAIIGWNISIESQEERERLIDKFVDDMLPKEADAEEAAAFMNLLDEIIERKNQYYPDINKRILDYELKVIGGNLHLNVVSSGD